MQWLQWTIMSMGAAKGGRTQWLRATEEEAEQEDCQAPEDGGCGPSTTPAFWSGGPSRGKDKGKFTPWKDKGKGGLNPGATAFKPY